MWSDRASPDELRGIVSRLHSILPAPAVRAADISQELPGNWSIEQLAEQMQAESGFAWIGGRLLRDPLVTISYSHGCAIVKGPGGCLKIPGCGFNILQAMLDAWSGPSGALL